MSEKTNLETIPCAICSCRETEPLVRKGQFGLSAFVSICPICGLVYLNPRWTKERYREFYAAEYDSFHRPYSLSGAPSARDRFNNSRIIWARLEPFLPKPLCAVLDIGAGMGETLDFIAQRAPGVCMAAIEASEEGSRRLSDNPAVQFLSADVDSDWQIDNEGRFELIIMRHVLEHLLHPVSALAKARHALSPNGLLYLAVPDMLSPTGSLCGYWFRAPHTYYFCDVTLERAAAAARLGPVVLQCQDNEVWGLFQRANPKRDFASVYEAQMTAIRAYQRKWRRRRLATFLPRCAKKALTMAKSFINGRPSSRLSSF